MALTGGQGKVKFSEIEGLPTDNEELSDALDSAGGGGGGGLVYCVKLTAGILITPTVLSNTTGATCTITNPSSGCIRLTFSSAVLTNNKTSVHVQPIAASSPHGAGYTLVNAYINSTTVIELYCSIMYGDASFAAQDYPDAFVTVTIFE